jgi:SAM-dependent methyltransferase
MSNRRQWEHRYDARSEGNIRSPSRFVVAQCAGLARGRALDVASGEGRHAVYLARRGWRVEAIDFAHGGLAQLAAAAHRDGLAIGAVQADLETFPLPRARYDLIVNVRYLQRSLIAAMKRAVVPGGMILFETFLRDQQQLGHPKNPAFLLERGELADRFREFDVLAYREGYCETESGPAFLAQMTARRPSHFVDR